MPLTKGHRLAIRLLGINQLQGPSKYRDVPTLPKLRQDHKQTKAVAQRSGGRGEGAHSTSNSEVLE